MPSPGSAGTSARGGVPPQPCTRMRTLRAAVAELFTTLHLLGVVAGTPPAAALAAPPPRWAGAADAPPRAAAVGAVEWANVAAKWGGAADGGGDGGDGDGQGGGGCGGGGGGDPDRGSDSGGRLGDRAASAERLQCTAAAAAIAPQAAAAVLRVSASDAYVRMTRACLFDNPPGSMYLELVRSLRAAAPADELALDVARAVLDAATGFAAGGVVQVNADAPPPDGGPRAGGVRIKAEPANGSGTGRRPSAAGDPPSGGGPPPDARRRDGGGGGRDATGAATRGRRAPRCGPGRACKAAAAASVDAAAWAAAVPAVTAAAGVSAALPPPAKRRRGVVAGGDAAPAAAAATAAGANAEAVRAHRWTPAEDAMLAAFLDRVGVLPPKSSRCWAALGRKFRPHRPEGGVYQRGLRLRRQHPDKWRDHRTEGW